MTEIKIETDSDVCNALKEELGGYRAFPASLAAAPDPVRMALAELVRLAESSRPLDDYRNCECTVCKMRRLALEVLRAQGSGTFPLGEKQPLTEEEQHAIDHARYQVAHASIVNPDCCFDYDLVKDLLRVIDRSLPAEGGARDR